MGIKRPYRLSERKDLCIIISPILPNYITWIYGFNSKIFWNVFYTIIYSYVFIRIYMFIQFICMYILEWHVGVINIISEYENK